MQLGCAKSSEIGSLNRGRKNQTRVGQFTNRIGRFHRNGLERQKL